MALDTYSFYGLNWSDKNISGTCKNILKAAYFPVYQKRWLKVKFSLFMQIG